MFDFFYSLIRKDKNEKGLLDVYTLAKKVGVDVVPFEMVHIAGTNGKGSVATMLHATFVHAGYTSGIFTSPHLLHPKERIKVGSVEIEEQYLLSLANEVYLIITKHKLDVGFFGIMLMCALRYFKEQKVDIAIIEAGIGGLLDTTNIIHSMLSIITTIGLDHTDVLGVSKNYIAKQKAGIIQFKTPVVLGPRANIREITTIAKRKNAPIFIAEEGSTFIEENENIAKKAIDVLQSRFRFDKQHIIDGLSTKPKGRFEKLDDNIYLDVGHNLDAMKAIIKLLPKKNVCVCLSFAKAKDATGMLEFLKTRVEHLHLFSFDHPKAIETALLKKFVNTIPNATYFPDFEKAFYAAKQKNIFILITGSFYFIPEVLCLKV